MRKTRREAGVDRLRDQLVRDAVVAKDVHLEEAGAVRAPPPRPRPALALEKVERQSAEPAAAAARAIPSSPSACAIRW